MIDELIAAAREARALTINVGVVGVDIEIVLTELGLVTRGERYCGDVKARASIDLDWAEFVQNPALLVTQVRIVNDALLHKVPDPPRTRKAYGL